MFVLVLVGGYGNDLHRTLLPSLPAFNLCHHVRLVGSGNSDLLPQFKRIEIGVHIDADHLLHLFFLMLAHIAVIIQRDPSFVGEGAELHQLVAVALLSVPLHGIKEILFQFSIDGTFLNGCKARKDGFHDSRLDDRRIDNDLGFVLRAGSGLLDDLHRLEDACIQGAVVHHLAL